MSGKKIRVLFISSWYPSRVNPTLGNFVQKHAEAVSLYADIYLLHVCFDDSVRSKTPEIIIEETRGIKAVFVYCKRTANALLRFRSYIKTYRDGLRMVIEKMGKPDLIHVNVVFPAGVLFYFSGEFKKYPYVVTEHWAGYLPQYPAKTGILKKYFIRKITKRASAVLPVSDDLRRAMLDLGFNGNYKVIPNVVDTSVFTLKQKERSAVNRILHISSLDDQQKNVTGIIRVINELYMIRRDFELHIVSDGDASKFIADAEKKELLDKAIFFHSTKTTAEVAEMMQHSDFLLLFSNYENLPCVIVEAYSAGLPVLSTDVGGISEHHTAKHGILVKAKDEAELLKAMIRMLDTIDNFDREFLHHYAEQHFSYEVVGKQIVEVYQNLIQGV